MNAPPFPYKLNYCSDIYNYNSIIYNGHHMMTISTLIPFRRLRNKVFNYNQTMKMMIK